jgi:hypothetical protein
MRQPPSSVQDSVTAKLKEVCIGIINTNPNISSTVVRNLRLSAISILEFALRTSLVHL